MEHIPEEKREMRETAETDVNFERSEREICRYRVCELEFEAFCAIAADEV